MRHCAAREALESRGARVDAQRDSVRVQLLLDEFMESLLDLADTGQLYLPHVVKYLVGGRLKVPGVLPHALGRALAAGAHAAVVAESVAVSGSRSCSAGVTAPDEISPCSASISVKVSGVFGQL